MIYRKTADRRPLEICVLKDQIPGSAWLSPSRTGKTTAISHWIRQFCKSAPTTNVYIFDPKGGTEFKLKGVQHVYVFSPEEPEKYLAAIKILHERASEMAKFKADSGITGSFQELWWSAYPGSGSYSPTLIICDEYVEQVEPDKSDSEIQKEMKSAMRNLLQTALRRYAGCAFHTVLASQSARATERALLGSATDNIGFYCYGRQEPAMAQALKIEALATDQELIGQGVFIFRSSSKMVKFYAI